MTGTLSPARAVVRTLNAAGRALARFGHEPISLEERSLLDQARRQTRLHDWGGDDFREPLRRLLDAYESEARLTLLGRIVARVDTVSLLANRLRLVRDRARYPGIAQQEIRRPLVIVGLPRTGSTALHHLLAQDPDNRVPQAWEVMAPSPPPERAHYDSDPRIARARRELSWLDQLAPAFKAIHPLGAQLPLECLAITSYAFLSQRFHTMYRVPSYQEWLLDGEHARPAYELHRCFLQHLQWRAPAQRWVLKAPSHVFGFADLLRVYPDALIVQTHRDPLTVLASVASLTAVLRGAFSDHVDLAEIGREVTRHWADGLARVARAARDGTVPPERFIDVSHGELWSDPLRVARRIYEHFRLPLSAEAVLRMRRYLGRYPVGTHGLHRYSLETFGLDREDLANRFRAYRDDLGLTAPSAAT